MLADVHKVLYPYPSLRTFFMDGPLCARTRHFADRGIEVRRPAKTRFSSRDYYLTTALLSWRQGYLQCRGPPSKIYSCFNSQSNSTTLYVHEIELPTKDNTNISSLI